MENKNEVIEVKTEKPLIEIVPGLLTVDDINRARVMVDSVVQIKLISLKATNASDWILFENKPCLQNSGCMKIAGLWGVSFESPQIEKETMKDDRGEYITFTVSGRALFRGRVVDDIGTASTRDPLFAGKKESPKPLAEIDLNNIKKSAITNWQSRILKKILGLAFEISDLEKVGIRLEKKFAYAKGGAGGGLISDAQGKRLFALLTREGKKLPGDLKAYLIENYNIEHTKDITREDYEAICAWAQNPNMKLDTANTTDGQGDAQEH